MIGDILGTPYEGTPRGFLRAMKSQKGTVWTCFTPGQHMGLYHLPPRWGMYTDDTNSTMALAFSLVENQGLWPLHTAHQYGRFWVSEPVRGYPDSAKAVMQSVLKGADIYQTGTLSFPTGSFANGGVMRIAPIGIAYRNATVEEIHAAVKLAISWLSRYQAMIR